MSILTFIIETLKIFSVAVMWLALGRLYWGDAWFSNSFGDNQ